MRLDGAVSAALVVAVGIIKVSGMPNKLTIYVRAKLNVHSCLPQLAQILALFLVPIIVFSRGRSGRYSAERDVAMAFSRLNICKPNSHVSERPCPPRAVLE